MNKIVRKPPRTTQTHFTSTGSRDERRKEFIDHLQIALQLEHATIPPYLMALYSIRDGANEKARHVLRSVAVEEMLHMALVANLLNAIGTGAEPNLLRDDFVPKYPTYLPNSDQSFRVALKRFSKPALETFLNIERPALNDAQPQHDNYASIGQFYAAIKDELDAFCDDFGEDELFQGDPSKQITPEYYYNGGGEVIPVSDYASARRALKVIVDEGEGFSHSIFSGDHEQFDEQRDLAHFYKFNELYTGRRYRVEDSPALDPTGDSIDVRFGDEFVYPVRFDLKRKEIDCGLRSLHDQFNREYWELLAFCHEAFNGTPSALDRAIPKMYELKYLAVKLMRIPADETGSAAGPTFKRPKDWKAPE